MRYRCSVGVPHKLALQHSHTLSGWEGLQTCAPLRADGVNLLLMHVELCRVNLLRIHVEFHRVGLLLMHVEFHRVNLLRVYLEFHRVNLLLIHVKFHRVNLLGMHVEFLPTVRWCAWIRQHAR